MFVQRTRGLTTPRTLRSLVPAISAAAALLCGGVQTAGAQPAAGPIVLRVPASARMLAMANVGLGSNDADALFYNPALLYNARGMALSLQRYGRTGTAGSLANTVTLGSINIGIGAQFLEWSARPLSYRELTRLGATALSDSGGVPGSSLAITLGIARTVFGRRVAVSAKYVEDRIGGAHDGTLAWDVGMMGPTIGPSTVSFVAQNLGAGLRLGGENGKLPTRFGIGWGGGTYPAFAKFDIGMQTQVTVDLDGFVRPAGGMELGYVPIEGVSILVRTGLRLPREPDEPLATGGLGVTVDRMSLDYAFEPFRGGRPVSHRLGIRIK